MHRIIPRVGSSRAGQALTEFALVAPLFFFLLFATVDGGLLLFSINSVDNASTLGMNAVAAYGRTASADFNAVAKMDLGGFANTSLIQYRQVTVSKLQLDTVKGGFVIDSTGKPVVDTGCGGPCTNIYTVTVNANRSVTVTLTNGASSCGDSSGCPPWPPGVRNVGSNTSDFVQMQVSYTYFFFTNIRPGLSLTSTKTFRLEPQS